MSPQERARIHAELDVLLGTCPPAELARRTRLYLLMDYLPDEQPGAAGREPYSSDLPAR